MEDRTPGFLLALRTKSGPQGVRTRVQEQDLERWGLTGEWAPGERATRVPLPRSCPPGGARAFPPWGRMERKPPPEPVASRAGAP